MRHAQGRPIVEVATRTHEGTGAIVVAIADNNNLLEEALTLLESALQPTISVENGHLTARGLDNPYLDT
jgi:hypothetical protein